MISVAPSALSKLQAFIHPSFNVKMAYACGAALLIAVIGCPLTSVYVTKPGILALGFGAIAIVALPVVLYLHEQKKYYMRDSLLVLLWAFYLTLMLGFPVTVAARLGMNIPLQDLRFAQWDRWLGIHVPDIQAWAFTGWQGDFLTNCYLLLIPFMQVAIVLPILTGKLKDAQRFIVANLIAFAIGLPIFAVLPGINPWYGDHFVAVPGDALCKTFVLLAIRRPGPYLYQYPAGAICFPSFHVIWAMLSVQALWGLRLLRVPAAIFAAVIIISTVTTGNHYVVDVLGGMVVAVVAMMIAQRISSSFVEHRAPSLRSISGWIRKVKPTSA